MEHGVRLRYGGPPRQPNDVVLVVDDEDAMRSAFEAALCADGFTVFTASSGSEALGLLAEIRPTVVLLDANLPDMRGEDVLVELRGSKRPEQPAVLIVSGDRQLDRKVAGLRLGADDYITKPVALAELVARVRRHAGSRHRWLAQLDDVLDDRRQLAQRIAGLDGGEPLHLLATNLLGIFSEQLDCDALSLTSALDGSVEHTILAPSETRFRLALERGASNGTRRPVIDRGEHGWTCHAPLEIAGSCFGVLGVAGTSDEQSALSAVIDLAPQIAGLVHRSLTSDGAVAGNRRQVEALLSDGGFWAEFQPIVDLRSGATVGFEALSRFPDGRRPDLWFRQATSIGLGAELELAAMHRILDTARALPADTWLSVNVSARTLIDHDLRPLLALADRRVILEITEHERVRDYRAITRSMQGLGDTGLGVDDAGSGYASLRHIFELQPELVKLDRIWVHGVHQDPVRTALITGLLQFATELDAVLLGEGVEHSEDRAALERIGVRLGQGYLFGRPRPAETWR